MQFFSTHQERVAALVEEGLAMLELASEGEIPDVVGIIGLGEESVS